jgi:glycosyltransferase involved in cell wall biosynthesis
MISIVTGTLNRLDYLKKVIENTVDSNDLLELVLVDGGSTDGTIEYLISLNHDRIKLIEYGERSYYWHYMNLGIKNSSHEWICQWNDDVILENTWDEVIEKLEDSIDFYLFSWKELEGGYVIYDTENEFVLNYGIYNKKIFKEIGMYNNSYKYYFCDGDMSFRCKSFGYKSKKLFEIRCNSTTGNSEKKAYMEDISKETKNYLECLEKYKKKILPENIEYL